MLNDNDMKLCAVTRIYVDVDGVLAKIDHRLPYMKAKDYDKFYGIAMADDEIDECGVNAVEALIVGFEREYYNDEDCMTDEAAAKHVEVVLVTGRPEKTRSITDLWLQGNLPHLHEKYARMLMRRDGDHRLSPEIKLELIKKDLLDNPNNDLDNYYIDDDPENVRVVCKELEKNGDYLITGIVHSCTRLKSSEQNS